MQLLAPSRPLPSHDLLSNRYGDKRGTFINKGRQTKHKWCPHPVLVLLVLLVRQTTGKPVQTVLFPLSIEKNLPYYRLTCGVCGSPGHKVLYAAFLGPSRPVKTATSQTTSKMSGLQGEKETLIANTKGGLL